MTTRRDLLGLTAGAVAAGAVPVVPQVAPVHPDAELIRVCAEHQRAYDLVNSCGFDDDSPGYIALYDAYIRHHDRLTALRATTREGAEAKMRSIMKEGRMCDGRLDVEGMTAAQWAMDTLQDLLAMGRA